MTTKPEPFCLMAHDSTTPKVIGQWMVEALKADVPLAKVAKAAEHRNAIIRWQIANPTLVKVPD